MASEYQDEPAVLQLLHAALGEYGAPDGIVSDNGSVFTAKAYENVLAKLDITPCYIDKRQVWQNLIESQFKIQLRLADARFEQAATLEEIQEQHAAFIQVFNTTKHWAHCDREDGNKTPVEVLAWQKGRAIDPSILRRAFRHLHFTRTVNQHGYVSVQRFFIYAERGLARQRVGIWIYQDRLHIEHEHTLLARYSCRLDRKSKQLKSIARPKLYQTAFASPQLELIELDETQWHKVRPRPLLSRRQPQGPFAKQLPLLCLGFVLYIILP